MINLLGVMGAFEYWARVPPGWDARAALADPAGWCSLSDWRPVDELMRGASTGPRELNRVYCIGLHRWPYQWERQGGRNPSRRTSSPWLYILPAAFCSLMRAGGAVPQQVARELARRDLLIPSSPAALTRPADLIRGAGHPHAFYVMRGEVIGLGSDAPAGMQAIAALARVYLSGWYAEHPPAELIPRPHFGKEPPRRRFDKKIRRLIERYRLAPNLAKVQDESEARARQGRLIFE
jgi:hypothetical protein